MTSKSAQYVATTGLFTAFVGSMRDANNIRREKIRQKNINLR